MLPYDFEGVVHGCSALSWPLSTLSTDRRHSGHSAPSWLLGSFMAFRLPPDGVLHINRELWRDVGLGLPYFGTGFALNPATRSGGGAYR